MAKSIFDHNFVKTRVEQEKRGEADPSRCPFGCGNIARIRVVDNSRNTVHLCCIVCAKKFLELHGEGCGQLLADEVVRLTKRAADLRHSRRIPCTCGMDDGLHEWNCAIRRASR